MRRVQNQLWLYQLSEANLHLGWINQADMYSRSYLPNQNNKLFRKYTVSMFVNSNNVAV